MKFISVPGKPLGKLFYTLFPGKGMVCFVFFAVLAFLITTHDSLAFEKTLSPTLKKPANEEVLRGIELIYNLQLDDAERIFAGLVAEEPKKPVGYFYMAMVSWSRLSIGFWTPQVLKEYVNRIDLTISVAKKRIENQDADSFDYFYLGGALGFKGRFELMRHNWFSSYSLAYEAIQALRKCAKMDPSNVDVLLGLGIYDYYTARLSGVVKLLTYLFLYKGNKEEGLRKLQIAADHAVYSSIEAKSMLLHIYLFMEKDFYKALPFAKELSEKFTGNPRYKFLEGVVYIREGLDDQYEEVLNSIRAESARQASEEKVQFWANQATYLEASYHLFRGQPKQARAKLDAILARVDAKADPAMVAWPLLKKGMSYDLQGQRNKALELYKRVLSMENGAGAQFLAEKYTDEPAEQGDPFLGY